MLANGALIVAAVFAVGFVGIGLGLKSRAGSEIDEHPSEGAAHGGEAAAPGAKEGGGITGPSDEGGTDPFDTHGTR